MERTGTWADGMGLGCLNCTGSFFSLGVLRALGLSLSPHSCLVWFRVSGLLLLWWPFFLALGLLPWDWFTR